MWHTCGNTARQHQQRRMQSAGPASQCCRPAAPLVPQPVCSWHPFTSICWRTLSASPPPLPVLSHSPPRPLPPPPPFLLLRPPPPLARPPALTRGSCREYRNSAGPRVGGWPSALHMAPRPASNTSSNQKSRTPGAGGGGGAGWLRRLEGAWVTWVCGQVGREGGEGGEAPALPQSPYTLLSLPYQDGC
jgi:hypothetical protein